MLNNIKKILFKNNLTFCKKKNVKFFISILFI